MIKEVSYLGELSLETFKLKDKPTLRERSEGELEELSYFLHLDTK